MEDKPAGQDPNANSAEAAGGLPSGINAVRAALKRRQDAAAASKLTAAEAAKVDESSNPAHAADVVAGEQVTGAAAAEPQEEHTSTGGGRRGYMMADDSLDETAAPDAAQSPKSPGRSARLGGWLGNRNPFGRGKTPPAEPQDAAVSQPQTASAPGRSEASNIAQEDTRRAPDSRWEYTNLARKKNEAKQGSGVSLTPAEEARLAQLGKEHYGDARTQAAPPQEQASADAAERARASYIDSYRQTEAKRLTEEAARALAAQEQAQTAASKRSPLDQVRAREDKLFQKVHAGTLTPEEGQEYQRLKDELRELGRSRQDRMGEALSGYIGGLRGRAAAVAPHLPREFGKKTIDDIKETGRGFAGKLWSELKTREPYIEMGIGAVGRYVLVNVAGIDVNAVNQFVQWAPLGITGLRAIIQYAEISRPQHVQAYEFIDKYVDGLILKKAQWITLGASLEKGVEAVVPGILQATDIDDRIAKGVSDATHAVNEGVTAVKHAGEEIAQDVKANPVSFDEGVAAAKQAGQEIAQDATSLVGGWGNQASDWIHRVGDSIANTLHPVSPQHYVESFDDTSIEPLQPPDEPNQQPARPQHYVAPFDDAFIKPLQPPDQQSAQPHHLVEAFDEASMVRGQPPADNAGQPIQAAAAAGDHARGSHVTPGVFAEDLGQTHKEPAGQHDHAAVSVTTQPGTQGEVTGHNFDHFKTHYGYEINGSIYEGNLTLDGKPWLLVENAQGNIEHLMASLGVHGTIEVDALKGVLDDGLSDWSELKLDESSPKGMVLHVIGNNTEKGIVHWSDQAKLDALKQMGVVHIEAPKTNETSK